MKALSYRSRTSENRHYVKSLFQVIGHSSIVALGQSLIAIELRHCVDGDCKQASTYLAYLSSSWFECCSLSGIFLSALLKSLSSFHYCLLNEVYCTIIFSDLSSSSKGLLQCWPTQQHK